MPTLSWRADQETHMLQGEGREVNKLLAAFHRSIAQLSYRAMQRTTADKLLLHYAFLKWRQTVLKDIKSTVKWSYVPNPLNFISAFRKDTFFVIYAHIRAWADTCVHVLHYHTFIHVGKCRFVYILHMYQIIHFYVSPAEQEKNPGGQMEL